MEMVEVKMKKDTTWTKSPKMPNEKLPNGSIQVVPEDVANRWVEIKLCEIVPKPKMPEDEYTHMNYKELIKIGADYKVYRTGITRDDLVYAIRQAVKIQKKEDKMSEERSE